MDIEESSNGSDMSFEEKPADRNIDADADVNESPEYAEEIDTYLRKCEVSKRYFICEISPEILVQNNRSFYDLSCYTIRSLEG